MERSINKYFSCTIYNILIIKVKMKKELIAQKDLKKQKILNLLYIN